MKIKVIGTNGMLSACLSEEFFAMGHIVDTYGLEKPEYHCSSFTKLDLLKDEFDYSIFSASDLIIYAAGAGVQAAIKTNSFLMYQLNVFVPVKLTQQFKKNDYKGTFISFGSYMEIGLNDDIEAIFSENDVICSKLRVTNDYALSKRLLGRYMNDFFAGFTHWHFILPNMFSHRDINPGTRLIPYVLNYLRQYNSGASCEIPTFSSGRQLRQYILMEDIITVITSATTRQMASGIYNVGGGEYMSVREVIERLFIAFHVPIKPEMFGKEVRRDAEIVSLHISGDKLFEQIHYLPSEKLEDAFTLKND